MQERETVEDLWTVLQLEEVDLVVVSGQSPVWVPVCFLAVLMVDLLLESPLDQCPALVLVFVSAPASAPVVELETQVSDEICLVDGVATLMS